MSKQKSFKIFMVEDSVNNHFLFKDAFEAEGFSVAIRGDAEGDFVEEVVNEAPDIISMDIMIGKAGPGPERDGLDALSLLKADERTKDIPVLMLTNFLSDEKLSEAKKRGAADYLNLQGFSVTTLPSVFKTYLMYPDKYKPINQIFLKE